MTYTTGWQRRRRPATKNGRGWTLTCSLSFLLAGRGCAPCATVFSHGSAAPSSPRAGGSVTLPFKKRRPFHKTWASDICADFNAKGACVFSERCKFRHMCAECGGGVATVLRPTKS